MAKVSKVEKFCFRKVYTYITFSNDNRIESLLAIWKNSKKCYLIPWILNTVQYKQEHKNSISKHFSDCCHLVLLIAIAKWLKLQKMISLA